MKKLTKILSTFILTMMMVFTSIIEANAAPESIQLGSAPNAGNYIAGVSFYHKKTTEGNPLYCLDRFKERAQNIQANLVPNSKNIDGGILYILKNGYPNKAITSDAAKDYYITQTAVWWYMDMAKGTKYLGSDFKETGSDNYGLRQYVKNLATEAYNHRNDSITIKDTVLELGTGNKSMTLKDGYFVSDSIKATKAQNITSYTVVITDAPKGTKIVSSNGTESTYEKSFSVKVNDTFKVKVPQASVSGTAKSIKVSAVATGVAQYSAYEYQPTDTKMQNVAMLVKTSKKVYGETTLEIASSKVSIVKVDSTTKKSIAGAKLVLKDANGKVVTSWVSTINWHIIRNLKNGTYTIEETEAPTGYILNKKVTKFTLSDDNPEVKITIENAPKKVVVNITKIDQETRNPLAGAVLVVKKSDGTELVRFTTSENSYTLTDLPNGTYTVEEISAPAGYMINTNKITFTIDDEHLSHQINFINAKEVVVPDTASASSIIMLILGIIITGTGFIFIKKHARA